MPRLSRRTKRRWAGYDQWHREHLETGFHIVGMFGFDCPAELREGWDALKADILRDWTRDHPGSRPWAWWKYESTEPRRRVDGGLHPFDDPAWHAFVADHETRYPHGVHLRALRFGVLNIHPQQVPGLSTAKYESQADYLRRLSLMTPEELARCQD